jgi:hypothetical protein
MLLEIRYRLGFNTHQVAIVSSRPNGFAEDELDDVKAYCREWSAPTQNHAG